MVWKFALCVTTLCTVLGTSAFGQIKGSTEVPRCSGEAAKVRIRTALRVIDSGIFLRGLTHDKFRVTSGKEVLDPKCFSPSDLPLTVGIVIDYSSSVSYQTIKVFIEGVRAFLRVANDKNAYFAVGFRGEPFLLLEPTSEVAGIERFLARAVEEKRSGQTALNDAIQLALSQFPDDGRARVLLVASDGADNYSRTGNGKEFTRKLRAASVRVYVFKYNNSGQRNVRTIDVDADSRLFGLADQTGGAGVIYSNMEPLDGYLDRLSRRLREEYTLGFTPSRAEDKWRPLVIEVKVPTDYPAIRSTGARWFFY
jgi:VWFA-related protein